MILVTGAKGVVGTPLCERLTRQNQTYVSVSRQEAKTHGQLQWNLNDVPSNEVLKSLDGVTSLIHCAPIWLVPKHLEHLKQVGVQRIVVFSSTSVISKRESHDPAEQILVKQLADAELKLNQFCLKNDVDLTIFRPSLIYGYRRDENVTRIANFIRRFGFMLLVGKGTGLRQPVHADDLVECALSTLSSPQTYAKTYNVVGAETLTYRELITRIFIGLEKKPRVLSVPLWSYRIALKLAAKLTSFSYTAEMANRMNQDLAYDCSAAKYDFNYAPQGFLNKPDRDL